MGLLGKKHYSDIPVLTSFILLCKYFGSVSPKKNENPIMKRFLDEFKSTN